MPPYVPHAMNPYVCRVLSTICFLTGTLLILSNRFDRYADKARPLPGLDPKLDVLPDEIPEEGY